MMLLHAGAKRILITCSVLAGGLAIASTLYVSNQRSVTVSETTAKPGFGYGAFRPRKGDRIAFFGDSLTQENVYPAMIETHYRLLHPELGLTFETFGVRGETSLEGQARVETQLAPFKPTVVFVEFGTNDTFYEANWNSENAKQRYANFQANYLRLLSLIIEKCPGARIVLCSTTVVDTVTLPTLFGLPLEGINDVLYHYCAFIHKTGLERGFPVIDIYTAMLQAVQRGQSQSPPLVLLPDGVHPSVGGYYYLASTILFQWGEKKIDAKD
jgi:lysophospholipase L1-like esterase